MRLTSDALRRWCGAICLTISGGMLIAGQTVLKAHLRQAAFLYYWLVCTLFTFLTLMIALLDLWIVRRRSRREQKKLLKETLGSMALDEEEDSDQRRQGE